MPAIVDGPIDACASRAGRSASAPHDSRTVRDHHEGRDVTGSLRAYRPMAEQELAALASETCVSTPGLRLAIEHRVGSLAVGEVSVAIAAAHARRAPSLAAAQQVIEVLKQRVPIWKREHYADGERRWVDPTA
jgi:molybdopterin synthase catalytic subunit